MRRTRGVKWTGAEWDDAIALMVEMHRSANRPALTHADAEERLIAARSADPADWPRCRQCDSRSSSAVVAIGLPCDECAAVESARLQRLFHPYRRALPDRHLVLV